MKPFVYSNQKNREEESNQWSRGGFDITYAKNALKTKHRESAVSRTIINIESIKLPIHKDEEGLPYYIVPTHEMIIQMDNRFS